MLLLFILYYKEFFSLLIFTNNWKTLLSILNQFWQGSHIDPSKTWITATDPLPG